MHKGLIALDIDGTVTDDLHHVPINVIKFLTGLHQEGWQLMFITGRTFSFGHATLQDLKFPYFFAVQNGADIVEMPFKKLVSRKYLPKTSISAIDGLYGQEKEDFIIYAGLDFGDFCFYRPNRFSPLLLRHLEKLKKLSPEPWRAVQDFNLKELDQFPLLKCLGSKEAMLRINALLKRLDFVHATLIRDPIGEGLFLNLVTAADATKGKALLRIAKHLKIRGPLIAAGDDLNDVSMLEAADVKVVMETAPRAMLDMAHIIAPSAQKEGIIFGLSQAIKKLDKGGEYDV